MPNGSIFDVVKYTFFIQSINRSRSKNFSSKYLVYFINYFIFAITNDKHINDFAIMKHLSITLLICMLTLTASAAAAHEVTLTIKGIRSDEGQILVMVESPSLDRPLYASMAAHKGSVSLTLDLPDEGCCDIKAFHDHDGDFKMRTDDKGAPLDGVAVVRYNPAKGKRSIAVSLYYAE